MRVSTSGTCTSASDLPYVTVAAIASTPAPPPPKSKQMKTQTTDL